MTPIRHGQLTLDVCREIVYAVTVNGETGFTATVDVCDNGESVNDDPDTFSITVRNSAGEVVET